VESCTRGDRAQAIEREIVKAVAERPRRHFLLIGVNDDHEAVG